MIKALSLPIFFFVFSFLSIHHFLVENIKWGNTRSISSEKPLSFAEQNTYKALTNNAPMPGPLFFAVEKNQLHLVKELIEKGHNVFALNEKRQNVLMVAVLLDRKEIFHFLVEQKFDLDHQDIYGMTALMYAAEKNQFDFMKPMLKKEHDLSILSAREKSALDYAKEAKSYAALKLLQKLEAPCNTSCEL